MITAEEAIELQLMGLKVREVVTSEGFAYIIKTDDEQDVAIVKQSDLKIWLAGYKACHEL